VLEIESDNFVIEEYSLFIESWKFRNTSSLVWS
jgi:hypothetical protein